MQISVRTIQPDESINFSSGDTWLAALIKQISPEHSEETDLRGNLTLKADAAGFVEIKGHLSGKMTCPCDRCGEPVSLTIDEPLTATFRPAFAETPPREMALTTEDLDVYFIEDGSIDIAQLINDTVFLAIPAQVHCEAPAACADFGDSADNLVYGDSNQGDGDSPFAILKNMNLT